MGVEVAQGVLSLAAGSEERGGLAGHGDFSWRRSFGRQLGAILTNELCYVYWSEGQAGANCGAGGVTGLRDRSSTKKGKDAALKFGGRRLDGLLVAGAWDAPEFLWTDC